MIPRTLIWLFLCGVGVAAALLLGGCGDTFSTPVTREYTKQTVIVTWHEVANEAELNAACSHTGEDKKILGCAYIAATSDTCTIYTHRNSNFETIGHEFMHCFTGRWHS